MTTSSGVAGFWELDTTHSVLTTCQTVSSYRCIVSYFAVKYLIHEYVVDRVKTQNPTDKTRIPIQRLLCFICRYDRDVKRIRSLDDSSYKETTIFEMTSWSRLSITMTLWSRQIIITRVVTHIRTKRVQSIRYKVFAKSIGIPLTIPFADYTCARFYDPISPKKKKVHSNWFVCSISLISCYIYFSSSKKFDTSLVWFTKWCPTSCVWPQWLVYRTLEDGTLEDICRQDWRHLWDWSRLEDTHLQCCRHVYYLKSNVYLSSRVIVTICFLTDKNMINIWTDYFLELSINVIWSDSCLLMLTNNGIFESRVPADPVASRELMSSEDFDSKAHCFQFLSSFTVIDEKCSTIFDILDSPRLSIWYSFVSLI